MPDVIEQLRTYARAAAESVPPVAAPSTSTATRGRRPARKSAFVVAAAVIAAAIVIRISTTESSAPQQPAGRVRTSRDRNVKPAQNVVGIEQLSPPPLAPRSDVAAASLNGELVIWGGDLEAENMGVPGPSRSYADGAVFNLANHSWRLMKRGPLPESATSPVAVATPDVVVIASDRKVASWDPAANTWRRFADAPGDVRDLTYDGREIVSISALASLDLGTGRWTALARPPLELTDTSVAWTGNEIVVLGTLDPLLVRAVAWAPSSRQWQVLPAPPFTEGNAIRVVWDGVEIFAVDYAMQAARYRPGQAGWTKLPRVPVRFGEGGRELAAMPASDTVAVVLAAPLAVWTAGRWVPMPWGESFPIHDLIPLAGPPAAGESTLLAAIGNGPNAQLTVSLIDPVKFVARPAAVQIGVLSIVMPGDASVTATRASTRGVGREAVVVDISTDIGPCTLISGYTASPTSGRQPPARWAPEPGTSERTWSVQPLSTDTVTVSCEQAEQARWIVDHSPASQP